MTMTVWIHFSLRIWCPEIQWIQWWHFSHDLMARCWVNNIQVANNHESVPRIIPLLYQSSHFPFWLYMIICIYIYHIIYIHIPLMIPFLMFHWCLPGKAVRRPCDWPRRGWSSASAARLGKRIWLGTACCPHSSAILVEFQGYSRIFWFWMVIEWFICVNLQMFDADFRDTSSIAGNFSWGTFGSTMPKHRAVPVDWFAFWGLEDRYAECMGNYWVTFSASSSTGGWYAKSDW